MLTGSASSQDQGLERKGAPLWPWEADFGVKAARELRRAAA